MLYLIDTELYKYKKITIDLHFFAAPETDDFIDEAIVREILTDMNIRSEQEPTDTADTANNENHLSINQANRADFIANVIEDTEIEESLIVMQQTIAWNEAGI